MFTESKKCKLKTRRAITTFLAEKLQLLTYVNYMYSLHAYTSYILTHDTTFRVGCTWRAITDQHGSPKSLVTSSVGYCFPDVNCRMQSQEEYRQAGQPLPLFLNKPICRASPFEDFLATMNILWRMFQEWDTAFKQAKLYTHTHTHPYILIYNYIWTISPGSKIFKHPNKKLITFSELRCNSDQ